MLHRFLSMALIAASLTAAPAGAATVEGFVSMASNNGPVVRVTAPDRVRLDFGPVDSRRFGAARFGGVEVDAASGRMYGHLSTADVTASEGYSASIRETVTITGPAGAGPVDATFRFAWSTVQLHNTATRVGEFVADSISTSTTASAQVRTLNARGVQIGTYSAVNRWRQVSTVVPADPRTVRRVDQVIFFDPSTPGLLPIGPRSGVVVGFEEDYTCFAISCFAGSYRFDLSVQPGDRLDLFAQLSGTAFARNWRISNSALNSGQIGLDLPEGWGFTSEGGLFLTQDPQPTTLRNPFVSQPAVIPLPAAGWLLLSAMVGLAGLGRMRRRA